MSWNEKINILLLNDVRCRVLNFLEKFSRPPLMIFFFIRGVWTNNWFLEEKESSFGKSIKDYKKLFCFHQFLKLNIPITVSTVRLGVKRGENPSGGVQALREGGAWVLRRALQRCQRFPRERARTSRENEILVYSRIHHWNMFRNTGYNN